MKSPLPFDVAAYLRDTQHLSVELHGAYCLLLFTMWVNDGLLPNDDRKLARIVKVHPQKWSRMKEELIEFFIIQDGYLISKKMQLIIDKRKKIAIVNRKNGMAGNPHKLLKNNEMAKQDAPPVALHLKGDLPLDIPKNPIKKPAPKSDNDEQFINFYDKYGRKKAREDAFKAFDKARKEYGFETIMQALKHDMLNDTRFKGLIDYRPFPASWLNECRRNKFEQVQGKVQTQSNISVDPNIIRLRIKSVDEQGIIWREEWTEAYGMNLKEARQFIANHGKSVSQGQKASQGTLL